MIGGAYLAFEATEKILEVVLGEHHVQEVLEAADDPRRAGEAPGLRARSAPTSSCRPRSWRSRLMN